MSTGSKIMETQIHLCQKPLDKSGFPNSDGQKESSIINTIKPYVPVHINYLFIFIGKLETYNSF